MLFMQIKYQHCHSFPSEHPKDRRGAEKQRERKQRGKVEARSTLSKCFYKNKAGFCEGQSLIRIQPG